MKSKKIAFVWFGITGRYGDWHDGLHYAMKEIEKHHTVTYHEPTDSIPEDAYVFFWEACCTINSKDGAMYRRIQSLPNKKALLFAGGPIQKEWVDGFDHVFVESKINLDEFTELGVPCSTAFGVNTDMFKPMKLPKVWDGIHHGASASWKRQWLAAEALKEKMLVVGRFQEEDPFPFQESARLGAEVLPQQPYAKVAELINQSKALIQTANYWGGGQRATLEALACDVPVICMSDSPKNREYVEESGYGFVVDPQPHHIKSAMERLPTLKPGAGREYVLSKWTHLHYAENLMKIL
jgi:glycosyltransferase involved in cell wall biosynthesis